MAELKFDVAIEKNLSGYSEDVVSSASRRNSKLTTEWAMLVGRVQVQALSRHRLGSVHNGNKRNTDDRKEKERG